MGHIEIGETIEVREKTCHVRMNLHVMSVLRSDAGLAQTLGCAGADCSVLLVES